MVCLWKNNGVAVMKPPPKEDFNKQQQQEQKMNCESFDIDNEQQDKQSIAEKPEKSNSKRYDKLIQNPKNSMFLRFLVLIWKV